MESSNTDFWKFLSYITLVLCLYLTSVNVGHAQESQQDSTSYKSFFGGYPIAFFTPETRWGFGAAGVYNHFPGKNKSSRPSQWQLGGAYTLNNQILSFCFYNIFLDDNKHNLFGEIGYYDYFYQYFGTGNQTLYADEELYSVQFPRIRVNYLRKWKEEIYIGGFFHSDLYDISEVEDEGLLQTSQINGYDGSVISRLGLLFRIDSRDNIFYPTKGTFSTLELTFNNQAIGATENYQAISLDVSKYHSFGKHILAFNGWLGQQFGEVPFQELLALGGGKKARGIITGRYRDKAVLLFQGEYRFPIYWRFSGAAFASAGNVEEQLSNLFDANWRINYGAGLRFLLDKNNKTNVRVDVAFGSDETNFYFTVNEAF